MLLFKSIGEPGNGQKTGTMFQAIFERAKIEKPIKRKRRKIRKGGKAVRDSTGQARP
jgi:hypothetical protein